MLMNPKFAALLLVAASSVLTVRSTSAGEGRPAPRVACTPVYLHTCVIANRLECRWATDSCGHRYTYEVRVITYADVYSDGTQQLYTRVRRA